jgi:hypothetical protein
MIHSSSVFEKGKNSAIFNCSYDSQNLWKSIDVFSVQAIMIFIVI